MADPNSDLVQCVLDIFSCFRYTVSFYFGWGHNKVVFEFFCFIFFFNLCMWPSPFDVYIFVSCICGLKIIFMHFLNMKQSVFGSTCILMKISSWWKSFPYEWTIDIWIQVNDYSFKFLFLNICKYIFVSLLPYSALSLEHILLRKKCYSFGAYEKLETLFEDWGETASNMDENV